MGSLKPNAARLKTAAELKRAEFEGEFGRSATPRRALRALRARARSRHRRSDEPPPRHGPGYSPRREDLMAMAAYIAAKRERQCPAEAQAARILLGRIQNERLGG